jgi:hypothetical protein
MLNYKRARDVTDHVASDANQNPIITGDYNHDHSSGYAFCDIKITGQTKYYFYVQVDYKGQTWYWPTSGSQKPLKGGGFDSTWAPVAASGSPSGYAAAQDSIGNGVSTAYPITAPPGFASRSSMGRPYAIDSDDERIHSLPWNWQVKAPLTKIVFLLSNPPFLFSSESLIFPVF